MIRRNQGSTLDLGVIVVGLLVAAFVCYEVDVFANQASLPLHRKTIDLDESLLLGVLFAVGMFAYCVRRLLEQKKEVRRRMLQSGRRGSSRCRIH